VSLDENLASEGLQTERWLRFEAGLLRSDLRTFKTENKKL
jgi:hypothetical protein